MFLAILPKERQDWGQKMGEVVAQGSSQYLSLLREICLYVWYPKCFGGSLKSPLTTFWTLFPKHLFLKQAPF
jgi:hypothetical protein